MIFDSTGASSLWNAFKISISTSTGAIEESIIEKESLTGEEIVDDTVCIEIYEPVCGVDGNVYWNSCFLEKAGVELDEAATATESWCVSE